MKMNNAFPWMSVALVASIACAPDAGLPDDTFAAEDEIGLTEDDKADGVWSWRRVWENAKKKAAEAKKETVERFQSMWDRGVEYASEHAREIWGGLKSLDCHAVVDGFSAFDPANLFLDRVWAPAGTCYREFKNGFVCAIPEMATMLGRVAVGSVRAAWDHRPACFRTAILTGPLGGAGFAACGFYYYARPKIEKMARCAQQLLRENRLWKALWTELWQLGCEMAGHFALDVVVDALSGGAGIPATIAHWVHKIAHALSPAKWLRIASEFGHYSVDSAAHYLMNVSHELSACAEEGSSASQRGHGH